MGVKPILFSGPMVRALLEGRKTQTRRVLKPWPGMQSKWLSMELLHSAPTCYLATVDGNLGAQMQHPRAGTTYQGVEIDAMSPLTWVRLPYASGDMLWVREAWCADGQVDAVSPRNLSMGEPIGYLADGDIRTAGCMMVTRGRNRPSMFMPRWTSRLTLRVTDVRVQRLQDISAEDAREEGCAGDLSMIRQMDLFGATAEERAMLKLQTCRWQFENLWNHLNANRGFGWDTNPWVAAYTFDVIRQNVDQIEEAD